MLRETGVSLWVRLPGGDNAAVKCSPGRGGGGGWKHISESCAHPCCGGNSCFCTNWATGTLGGEDRGSLGHMWLTSRQSLGCYVRNCIFKRDLWTICPRDWTTSMNRNAVGRGPKGFHFLSFLNNQNEKVSEKSLCLKMHLFLKSPIKSQELMEWLYLCLCFLVKECWDIFLSGKRWNSCFRKTISWRSVKSEP